MARIIIARLTCGTLLVAALSAPMTARASGAYRIATSTRTFASIAGTGTLLNPSTADGTATTPLPFTFRYLGTTVRRPRLCT